MDYLRRFNRSVAVGSRYRHDHGRLDSYSSGHRDHRAPGSDYLRTKSLVTGLSRSRKGTMNKVVSIALLVGGVALMILGFQATKSFSSDVSRFFTGSPTDKAVWMLIGGLVAAVVGLTMTLRSSRRG